MKNIKWSSFLNQSNLKFYFIKLISSQFRDFWITFSGLVLFFCISIYFFFSLVSLPEKVQKSFKALEKRKVMQKRKNKIDEESRKRIKFTALDKILVDVLNTHQTKELQLVSQFHGMEGLKGHEKKLILERRIFDSIFQEKESVNSHPFREVFYEMNEPLILTDLELKALIIKFDELKIRNPSLLINKFIFEKKKIDDQEKYQVNFSFIIREKIENTS